MVLLILFYWISYKLVSSKLAFLSRHLVKCLRHCMESPHLTLDYLGLSSSYISEHLDSCNAHPGGQQVVSKGLSPYHPCGWLWIPVFWLQHDAALAVVDVWGVNQRMEYHVCLSLLNPVCLQKSNIFSYGLMSASPICISSGRQIFWIISFLKYIYNNMKNWVYWLWKIYLFSPSPVKFSDADLEWFKREK